jgi:hypothetical protein
VDEREVDDASIDELERFSRAWRFSRSYAESSF